ncbi:MAG: hypothetical protein AB1938_22465 [Myxococcota bacterium]
MARRVLLAVSVVLFLAGCGGAAGGAGFYGFSRVDGLGDMDIATLVYAASKDDVYLQSAFKGLHKRAGATWEKVALPGGAFGVGGLWAASPTDVWATLDSKVIRFDGTTWTEFADLSQVPQVNFSSLGAIHGCSVSEVWVLDGFQGLAAKWDGTRWTRYLTQQPQGEQVFCLAPGDVWVTTSFGLTHLVGGAFVEDRTIRGGRVWGASATQLWSAGDDTQVSFWDGSAWTAQPLDDGHNLEALWGTSPTDIWAIGNFGAMAHFDGASWTRIDTGLGNEQSFSSIHASGPDDVWIVGNRGVILHKGK